MARLLLVLDLAGIFLFAIESAMTGAAAGLDTFGVLVLSFTSSLGGGGIVRDLLIGATPPNAIKDYRYPTAAFFGGALVCLAYHSMALLPHTLLVALDAAGLALFAIAGARKALDFGTNALSAVLMAAVTGSGGGVITDVLLSRVPSVLHSEIYATAAILGASVMILGMRLGGSARTMALAGGLACFTLRVVSVWRDWSLPHLA